MLGKFCLTLLCVSAVLPVTGAAGNPVVDRDEFSTTVQLPDGKLKTSVSTEPVSFRENGEWKVIDTSLEPGANGTVHPASVAGEVEIPASLSQPLVLEHAGAEVSVRLKGATGGRDGVQDSTAEFEDALTDVDAQYAATAQGVKETLVLHSSSAPEVFNYDLRAAASWSAAVVGDDVVLRDSAGDERYRITAPLAWDSATDPSFTDALVLSIDKVSDGRWTLTLTPDADWLNDPARVFPLSIDPDFSWANGTTHFHGATDCYIASLTPQNNYSFCSVAYLTTGYYNRAYKSLLKFDIASAIPTNATVSAATFKAYAPPTSPKLTAQHKLYTLTSDWDNNVTWNNRKTSTPWTTAGGDVSTNPSYTSTATAVQAHTAWYSWAAPTATVQNWVNGTLPNYGFLLQTEAGSPSNNSYVFASTEASMGSQFPASSNEWPTLDVTWSTSSVDTTPPSPPSDLELGARDSGTSTAPLTFVSGMDEPGVGETASGVDRTEVRIRHAGGPFSGWSTAISPYAVAGLSVGELIDIEMRTIDVADNVSETVAISRYVPSAGASDAFRAGAVAHLEDEYGLTASQAADWLDVQASAAEARDAIEVEYGATLQFAGMWLDPATQTVHVNVDDEDDIDEIESIVDALEFDSSVEYHEVQLSDAEKAFMAARLQDSLRSDIDAGWLQVGYNGEFDGIGLRKASGAPSGLQDRIDVALAQLGSIPPTQTTVSTATKFEAELLACENPGPNLSDLQATCDAPIRGGLYMESNNIDSQKDPSTCTTGFNVRSQVDEKPYVLTAGHCFYGHDDVIDNVTEWRMRVAGDEDPGAPLPIGDRHSFMDPSEGGDAGLIEISDELQFYGVPSWLWTQDPLPPSYSEPHFDVTSVQASTQGETLCMAGARSGTACGTIPDIESALGQADGNWAMIDMCGVTVPDKGDSGAAMFAETADGSGKHGTGRGLMRGFPSKDDNPCRLAFQSLHRALADLDVFLVTPPYVSQNGGGPGRCSPFFCCDPEHGIVC